MDTQLGGQQELFPTPASSQRRASASSGLLSKLPFMKASVVDDLPLIIQQHDQRRDGQQQGGPRNESSSSASIQSAPAAAAVQQRTRRRRGSLRKVALLGRGAQRDRTDSKLGIDNSNSAAFESPQSIATGAAMTESYDLGLNFSDTTPRPSVDTCESQAGLTSPCLPSNGVVSLPVRDIDPSNLYNSTTDEEDLLQLSHVGVPARAGLSISSGSDSYFPKIGGSPRRQPFQKTKSPLSYSGLPKTALPPSDADWDYTETEWWGWVVLGVTWCVFVVGMGSCFDVWSWAWDVGKTPYAPPELEDDPTLPIVGYYPALIILTGVMAWVWVGIAWVGMKYFRHAKISGD